MLSGLVAGLTVGFYSLQVQAGDNVIRVRENFGISSYAAPAVGDDISSTYTTWGLGFTHIWASNLFVDYTFKLTGKGDYNAKSNTPTALDGRRPFTRTEHIVTVGMPLDSGLQVNGGFFTAETNMELAPDINSIIAPYDKQTQSMMGFTGGVGHGLELAGGRYGVLAVNGALALLVANTNRGGTQTNSSLAYGLSFGALYGYSFKPVLSTTIDTKYQAYFINYPGFSGNEKILSLNLSLIAKF